MAIFDCVGRTESRGINVCAIHARLPATTSTLASSIQWLEGSHVEVATITVSQMQKGWSLKNQCRSGSICCEKLRMI